MTGPQKLQYVRGQIEQLRLRKSDSLECPYCGLESFPGKPFCCETLSQACTAILHRERIDDLLKAKARIEEMASGN